MLRSLVALALHGGPVHAPPPLELRWSAPPGCPDEAGVRSSVRALLGRELTSVDADAIAVDGEIVRRDRGWSLRLTITSASGSRTRELPGESCQDLSGVAALLIAIAIDPTMESIDAPPPAAEPTPPPAREPVASPPVVAPQPRRKPMIGGAFGVHGVLGYGALPRIDGALGPDAALRIGAARIELAGSFWWPSPTRARDASLRLWHVDVRGCWAPSVARRVELPLCGGLQLGAMIGRGDAIARPTRGRLPWVAMDLGFGVMVLPVWRVGLRLDVRGVAPLVRPGFAIDDHVVFRARPVAIAATLGVELRLGPAR